MNPVSDAAVLLAAIRFAAEKHRLQRRKDSEASPYINHAVDVASLLAIEGGITNLQVIIAGVLHDTLEDTETTPEELAALFGAVVLGLVQEVTDDKGLPKAVRKQLQIAHAINASCEAQAIKIADKVSNLRDVVSRPPANWSTERRQEYLEWSRCVVDRCRGSNPELEKLFDDIYETGRLALAKLGKDAKNAEC